MLLYIGGVSINKKKKNKSMKDKILSKLIFFSCYILILQTSVIQE